MSGASSGNLSDAAADPADGLLDDLTLSLVSGVGPRLWQGLIERFGSATAVLDASPSELREVRGLGAKTATAICRARETIDAASERADCEASGVTILTPRDPRYPAPLRTIPDPPGVLYLRGRWEPRDALSIAIVGSRHATQYGLKVAEQLATSLARAGLTIVSGLARGIDGAAHTATLNAGGRTLAVLGSGVLNIYPPEHAALSEVLIQHGALISESPPRREPFAGMFPQRNRIISGLSLGTIVIEAGARSGALITARHAGEQNREVFAVPGRIDNRMSQGCHRLLRDGAILVESADDVLSALGPLPAIEATGSAAPVRHPAELNLNDTERRVLAEIDTAATSIDVIVERTGLASHQVLATLSVLEVRRLVRRVSGSLVQRP